MRPVFKAFTYGEYAFSSRYCPLGSHEERLTGHLLFELCSALATVSPAVASRSIQTYGQEVKPDFIYEDLAAGNREKYTGADFGIILHVNIPGMPEPHIRGAVFQAKKMASGGDSASVDLKQLHDIIRFATKEGACYCFYDCNAALGLSSVVLSAEHIARMLSGDVMRRYDLALKELPASGSKTVHALESASCSLAEFLVFGMALRGAGHAFQSLREAVSHFSRQPGRRG